MKFFSTIALALAAGFACNVAHAAEADDLLAVDKAFVVEAQAVDRSTIRLDWKLAEHYYLYRDRIKVTTTDAGVTLAAHDLPAGEKKHDEYLGDVEVYHKDFSSTQALTAPADLAQINLAVRFQGCHEVDPKICFPPHTTKLTVALGGAAATAKTDDNPVAQALAGGASTSIAAAGNSEPLPVEKAFVYEAIATGPNEILARFTMPKGYYLYRDKTRFSATDATLGTPRWPPGTLHKDENFGATTVYFDQVEIPIPVMRKNTAAQTLSLTAHFQGCLEGSVCYPLTTRALDVALPAGGTIDSGTANAAPSVGATSNTAATTTTASAASESDDSQFARALNGSLWFTFTVFFLAGVGLAFTPCVFPMIPILSGIIAGAGENLSTRRAIVLSLVYVLASAVIFTLAGVVAGLAGKNLQAAFQTPWVLWCFAGLFVLLALSMFGFYELQLPSSWQNKLAGVSNKQASGSLTGVAVMGALSALIVGPCVTPPLAVAVLYIAQKHDALLGGFALFTLALGMGAPLVVFGASAGRFLPRAGAWMDAVKAVFGVTFLGLAIWMLSRILDSVWIMLMVGALAVASAVYLGALERLPDGSSGWRKLAKALGVLLLILGAAELIGTVAGSNDVLQPLRGFGAGVGTTAGAQAPALPFRRVKSIADVEREVAAAKAANKPAMFDFYADWCVSCKEMEKYTFSKTEVHHALADFVLLQADVTANDDVDQALMQHYNIVAPPDTLFFGTDGSERRALRLTGQEDADKFLRRIATAVK
ncbi:MAG TPA: protein-disulfide reductase DsbD [Rudaea sp.]|jgi:thiol:disulfide interchange protein DsbD|uniref:protein-disulfide reductase DsbD n=1 Tax=Rudaea sp. TaxID=2136325 RepID=UPI002F94F7F5